jgi:hypothetical protein
MLNHGLVEDLFKPKACSRIHQVAGKWKKALISRKEDDVKINSMEMIF